jgi:pimeloyl-ACP methyl ester carboxylesterase
MPASSESEFQNPRSAVPLSYERVDGVRPERAIYFLHGILGRGINLRSIARQFVAQRPGWSAVLVDLRGHGKSPKGSPDPSLEAAARDVLHLDAGIPLAAVAGHSFGGKVALEMGRLGTLPAIVVIDSVPGARDPVRNRDGAVAVIETLEALPAFFESRTTFVDAIVEQGQSRAVAQWLAGSLEASDRGVRFALDLAEIKALLADYFARELWPIVEQPPAKTRLHLIIGEQSGAFTRADRERARSIAAVNSSVSVDVLPTGHWVHVEDPEGLQRLLLNYVG